MYSFIPKIFPENLLWARRDGYSSDRDPSNTEQDVDNVQEHMMVGYCRFSGERVWPYSTEVKEVIISQHASVLLQGFIGRITDGIIFFVHMRLV